MSIMPTLRSRSKFASRRQQRGVVLLLALIMLVAMTLAGIGMMRSVDTGMIIAGNMAFKQSTLQGTDSGYRTGINALNLQNTANPSALEQTGAFAGYRAVACDLIAAGTAGSCATTWWNSNAAWDGAPSVTLANGVTVQYWIDRMCNAVGTPGLTSCMMYSENKDKSGSSPFMIEYVFYRITARATGPRNSVSYTQTLIKVLN